MATDALRSKLIDAGRILAGEGQGDYVAGHVSVRTPDEPNRILMKPANIGLDEMTEDNIVTIDLDGEKIAGTAKRHSEVYIHTEIMRARPDVQAVIHTHAMHAVVFSSLGRPLLPVGNDGTFFCDNLPIFAETTDLIVTPARGRAVAACLGPSFALILRNHGIAAAGRSLEEAVWWALKLERACHAQLLAEAAGGPRLVGSPEDAKAKGAWANRTELHESVFGYLSRRYAPRPEAKRGG